MYAVRGDAYPLITAAEKQLHNASLVTTARVPHADTYSINSIESLHSLLVIFKFNIIATYISISS